jgi:hypothetical protein
VTQAKLASLQLMSLLLDLPPPGQRLVAFSGFSRSLQSINTFGRCDGYFHMQWALQRVLQPTIPRPPFPAVLFVFN